MRVLDDGHKYALKRLDGEGEEVLTFVKRVGEKFPGNTSAYAGTISQEVLRALVQRADYVNAQIPCWQTQLSAFLMEFVIWLYEWRAAKRHGRKRPSLGRAVYGIPHALCGHVGCKGGCQTVEGEKEEK